MSLFYTVQLFHKVHYFKVHLREDYFLIEIRFLQKAHVCTLLVFCGAMHKLIYKKFILINKKRGLCMMSNSVF